MNFLKKASKITFKLESEKKLYNELDEFGIKQLNGKEKIELSSFEIGVRFYYSKKEIKEGVKNGYAVCVDCFNRYFLFYCKKKNEVLLLKIDFNLNEIFGGEITEIMDIREEKILGKPITFEEADKLINNYIEWMDERDANKKVEINEVREVDESLDKWVSK